MMTKKLKQRKYDEDSITALSPIEGLRRKASMYIGGLDEKGLHHIVAEPLDNVVDEFLAGRGKHLSLLLDGDYIWVGDCGAGIPIGKNKQTKLSTLTTVLTQIHAGGKFDDAKAYGAVGGTHGIGVTATNATSETLDVWTCRDKQWYEQSYKKGVPNSEPKKCKAPKLPKNFKATGTIFKFKPDRTIFNKGAKLDEELLWEWCEISSFINPGLTVEFVDSKGKHTKWLHKRGLEEYVEKLVADEKDKILSAFKYRDKLVDVAFAVTNKQDDLQAHTNSIYNPDGGIHADNFWQALYDAIRTRAKRKDEFEIQDIVGIQAVINVRIREAVYANQVKHKLTDKRAEKIYEPLFKAMKKWVKANAKLVDTIIETAKKSFENRNFVANDRALNREINKAKKVGTLIPGKLTMCPKAKPAQRELYLLEGDSATGTAKIARDKNFQEILALKGKPVNAAKKTADVVFANKEVKNILIALGYQPTAKDPLAKLRVANKVILLSDPDADGSHINLLVLALFARVMPGLFERGMVYSADVPEYMTTYKGKRYFDKSKDGLYAKLPKGAKCSVQHIKGWSEINPDVLKEVAFNPATRMITQITADKAKEISKFMHLMGDGIEERKKLIGLDVGTD